jgi:NAD(P)-dependent dehydrogenase (short-subunit alcohol dehydrogenase family)
MAKAGVLAMTKSLAVEWGPKGIRAVAISPGAFPTKGAWDRLVPASMAEHWESFNPLAAPESIANSPISPPIWYPIRPATLTAIASPSTVAGGCKARPCFLLCRA